MATCSKDSLVKVRVGRQTQIPAGKIHAEAKHLQMVPSCKDVMAVGSKSTLQSTRRLVATCSKGALVQVRVVGL